MARQRKDHVALHIKFDAELMKRLNVYCDEEARTKTDAVERMVRAGLDKWEADRPEQAKEFYEM